MNGCSDSDGDGVADNEDRCPKTAGEKANGGCPWTDSDGDGVPDKDDECPEVAGTAGNKGCPDEPIELINFINSENNTILFSANSNKLDSNDKVILDIIKEVHIKYDIVLDPHSAIGLGSLDKVNLEGNNIVLATAHPCKFPEAIDKSIGIKSELPLSLIHI